MNPLSVLGLEIGDSLKDAKDRRNELLLKYHPDKYPNKKEAEDKTHEIQDAYEIIDANPSILQAQRNIDVGNLGHIRVQTTYSIEHLYFGRKKTIYFWRRVLCDQCKGTGSRTGKQCRHCGGKGKIESSVLALMDRDDICPVCKGSGIPSGESCESCSGTHFKEARQAIDVSVFFNEFRSKIVILEGYGNQSLDGTYGNVYVELLIKPNDQVWLEEDHFCVYCKVSPVQKIIGDTGYVDMFGRRIPFKIGKNCSDSYTKDNIGNGVTHTIRVRFIDLHPVLTEETIALYKKILEIERGVA
jgi:molecular chaperone DnaJ